MIAKTKHLNCEKCKTSRQVAAWMERYTCRTCRPSEPDASKKELAADYIAIVDIETLEVVGIGKRLFAATVAWTPGTHIGIGATKPDAVRAAMQRVLRTRKRFEALGKEYSLL